MSPLASHRSNYDRRSEFVPLFSKVFGRRRSPENRNRGLVRRAGHPFSLGPAMPSPFRFRVTGMSMRISRFPHKQTLTRRTGFHRFRARPRRILLGSR
jgi:hypothetical protein